MNTYTNPPANGLLFIPKEIKMENVNADNMLNWLFREARRVLQSIPESEDATPQLWAVAVDALGWLRQVSIADREQVLLSIRSYLKTREIPEANFGPKNQREEEAFVTLLRFVVKPPRML
jgi:hypothetical protein